VLFVLVAGTVAAVATGSAAGGPAARTSYQVIQLSPDLGATGFINNRDQMVYTETRDGVFRPRLYDAGQVRELGTLGGVNAYAVGLNDHGQVVGASEFSPGRATTHAFRWTRGAGMIDLDPAGSADSVAIAINNNGHVVGRAWFGQPGQTARHAFHWTPQTGIVDLTPGASVSSANDINDAGTAVGFVGVPSGDPEGLPFRWTRSEGVVPLTTFSSRGSDATDINAVGQITGTSTFPGQDGDRAFFWGRQDGIVNLGSGSGQQSEAGRLNDKGLVIGVVEDPFESTRPLAWTRAGGLIEFAGPGVDGVPRDVNNAGQVVGDLENRAFVWTRPGGVVDLNTRVPGAPPGLVLRGALSISDNGAIVALANTGLVLLVPRGGHNAAPVAGPIQVTGTARVGALLSFAIDFKDADPRDTHSATWTWGDGASEAGSVSAKHGAGSVSGQHVYRKAGIYTVRLVIRDSGGKTVTAERRVVVCGAGAHIAGEGAFMSAPDTPQKHAARATYAFLGDPAQPQRASVRFHTLGLQFESTRILAQSVDGGQVRIQGSGAVNGRNGYDFTMSAGKRPAGVGDQFHIRIVLRKTGARDGVVVYDNHAAGTGQVEGSVVESGSTLSVSPR
jgi:probable HAF family extracellular repeat protein